MPVQEATSSRADIIEHVLHEEGNYGYAERIF
jgi:hypothetical protein